MSCKFSCTNGWLIDPEKDYQLPCPDCNPELDQAKELEVEFRMTFDRWHNLREGTMAGDKDGLRKQARYFFFAGAAHALGKEALSEEGT